MASAARRHLTLVADTRDALPSLRLQDIVPLPCPNRREHQSINRGTCSSHQPHPHNRPPAHSPRAVCNVSCTGGPLPLPGPNGSDTDFGTDSSASQPAIPRLGCHQALTRPVPSSVAFVSQGCRYVDFSPACPPSGRVTERSSARSSREQELPSAMETLFPSSRASSLEPQARYATPRLRNLHPSLFNSPTVWGALELVPYWWPIGPIILSPLE